MSLYKPLYPPLRVSPTLFLLLPSLLLSLLLPPRQTDEGTRLSSHTQKKGLFVFCIKVGVMVVIWVLEFGHNKGLLEASGQAEPYNVRPSQYNVRPSQKK